MSASRDIAVVTGASGGIGAAVARLIHERGGDSLRLALHCNGNAAAAEKLGRELPGSFVVPADLSIQAGRSALVRRVLDEGVPFILVNNAGVDRPHEPALEISEEAFDRILAIDLKSPLFLMRDFGREMVRAGSGVIVNISSILARSALTGSAAYRAAKAALEAATLQFAAELGPRGVRVNAVAPGFIVTPMTEGLPDPVKQQVLSQVALGQFGEPGPVASAVCHLIENDYVNGAVLSVDGGMRL